MGIHRASTSFVVYNTHLICGGWPCNAVYNKFLSPFRPLSVAFRDAQLLSRFYLRPELNVKPYGLRENIGGPV